MLFPTFFRKKKFGGGGAKKNCGVGFLTYWREISGDRVALFQMTFNIIEININIIDICGINHSLSFIYVDIN